MVLIPHIDATIATMQQRMKVSSMPASAPTDLLALRTELDSHANMAVVGKHCVVFDKIYGKTCEVEPFDPSIGTAKEVPVVDAALAYDCPYTGKTFILILRNTLYIKSLEHNLIPPFLLHKAGLKVNECPYSTYLKF